MLTFSHSRSLFATFARPAVVVIAVALLLGLMVACEAEPTPTPTPLPTATPTATPTPEPTPEPAAPMLLMSDIMGMVSAEEQECVRAAVGEDVYNLMLQTPFTPDMMTADAAASPVAACLSPESQAAIAQAVMGGG